MCITEEELHQILTRCDDATPGPWRSFVEGRDHTSGSNFIQTPSTDIEITGGTVADQEFIAAAKQDILRLVAEIAKLKKWAL